MAKRIGTYSFTSYDERLFSDYSPRLGGSEMSHGHPPHKQRPIGTCYECVAEQAEAALAKRDKAGYELRDRLDRTEEQLAEAVELLKDYVHVYPDNSGRTIRFLKRLENPNA